MTASDRGEEEVMDEILDLPAKSSMQYHCYLRTREEYEAAAARARTQEIVDRLRDEFHEGAQLVHEAVAWIEDEYLTEGPDDE